MIFFFFWSGTFLKVLNLSKLLFFVLFSLLRFALKTVPFCASIDLYWHKHTSLYSLHVHVIRSREISLYEVGLKCDFFIFLFDWSWSAHLVGEVHFAKNPTWIGQVVPKQFWPIEGFSKQKKIKEIHSFFWLYLTINAPNFWLIPLDCNTYITFKQNCKLSPLILIADNYYMQETL